MPCVSAAFAQAIMPSKTTRPLNCSSSVRCVTERSKSAYGSAGESVTHKNAPRSSNSRRISSSGFAPCSMESTPFSSATRTPSGDSVCAATV